MRQYTRFDADAQRTATTTPPRTTAGFVLVVALTALAVLTLLAPVAGVAVALGVAALGLATKHVRSSGPPTPPTESEASRTDASPVAAD